jgi:hypothetical protein
MLLSMLATTLVACRKHVPAGPLAADAPVDDGFTGCTA